MKYDNRVVVFIDILGFKEIIDATTDVAGNDIPKNIDRIIDAYTTIRDVWDLDVKPLKQVKKIIERENKKQGKVVTIFSDTVVVSFLQKAESEIFHTLLEVGWMIGRLIDRGILCRGAVSYGKLIHDSTKIFGPALVSAYVMESKAALYPRIILSPEILELVEQAKARHHSREQEKEYVMHLLKKDSDGMLFVDYFDSIQSEFDEPEYDYAPYLQKIYDIIQKGINSTKTDVSIKYMWLRERYNETVVRLTDKKAIKNLINAGRPELAELYGNLKIA